MKPRDRPRIIANFALSADGKVSTRALTPAKFTSAADKRRLLEIRARHDALIAGASTVARDSMSMRLRPTDLRASRTRLGMTPEPLRVIVSNRGKLDPDGKVFRSAGAPVSVFTTRRMPQELRARLSAVADLWIAGSEQVDLSVMLQILRHDYGIKTAVCEGGPRLFRSLAALDLVDELYLTWTPVVFGGRDAPTLTGLPDKFLPFTLRWTLQNAEVHGDECFLTYVRSRGLRRRSRGLNGG